MVLIQFRGVTVNNFILRSLHNEGPLSSGAATGGLGGNCPHFCLDGARYFLKIDQKIGGEGVVANPQKSGGLGQKFHLCPHFSALVTPLTLTLSTQSNLVRFSNETMFCCFTYPCPILCGVTDEF